MPDLYVIKKEGKGASKIVTTTESYLHAMREISIALRAGQQVTAKRVKNG